MIGLGTYSFFWQHSEQTPAPLSLRGALEETRDLGVGLFQICDYAPLLSMSDREVRDAARVASDLGIRIQLGTRGVGMAHLGDYLSLAGVFDATLVRSMVTAADMSRGAPAVVSALRQTARSFGSAGVTLALETYEQIATEDLVAIIEDIGSDRVGICLDPANVVARLERPGDCVLRSADRVVNVHVKDFAFRRREGWVGFELTGSPLGTGLLDYAALSAVVAPRTRGVDEIVEHWLPWQGDAETTIRAEREWTRIAIDNLRSMP